MSAHFSFTKFFRTIVLMATANSPTEDSTTSISSSSRPVGIGEGMEMRRRKVSIVKKNAPRFCNSWPPVGVSKSQGSIELPVIHSPPPVDLPQTTPTVDDQPHVITIPNAPHSPQSSPSHLPGENPIVRMLKDQGLGKHAVNMVWAVVIQILTSDHSGSTHPLDMALAVIILSLLFGFAVTWNGLLLRGWLPEGAALGLEQLGLSIIYLTLVSFVALHVFHCILELLPLLLIGVLVVLPFVIANVSGRVKDNAARN